MGITNNLGKLSNMITSTGSAVGIGITNPTQTFQVYSTASTTSSIFETNNVNSYIALKSTSGTNYIGNVSYGMSFEAGGSERMRITSAGNVGIATTSPANLLHLAGASSTPSLRLGSTSLGYYWDIGRENASTGDFVFNNAQGGASSERMRITTGGNVGIGTSSPQVLLHLYDASLPRIQFSNSTTGTASTDGFQIYQSGLTAIVTNKEAGDIVFGTSDTERMRISSTGTVTIQRPSSGATLLQLNGTDAYGDTSTINLCSGRSYIKSTILVSANGNTNITFGTYNGSSISERMRITDTGNVLINTTTDLGAKLYVDGVIYANGAGGFASATYVTGVRNPIWRFGNADAYGISYFQGTAGYGGNDTIGFTFGGSTTTSSGSAFQFIQNGNYIFAGSPISDRRAKENINDITFNATEKVMALQSRSYYMKEGNNKIKYGFIAQEVYEVLPDLISGDLEKDSIVGLDYNGLIPVLVKAIQELETRLKTLENK